MGTKVWILRKEFLSKNLKFFFGGEAADLASLARAVPKPLAIVVQAFLYVSTPYGLVETLFLQPDQYLRSVNQAGALSLGVQKKIYRRARSASLMVWDGWDGVS